MPVINFLIGLGGATMLLLFAVRMVGTGIERAMGPSFRRLITRYEGRRLSMALVGILLAIILQSATAVALLATGFAVSGLISFVGGLALVLGADFGSALVIQILSFKLHWLIPVLLASGGYMFLKTEGQTVKQIGRIFIGIALILLSLRLIGEAVHPIRDSAFLPALSSYLASDFVTAFLVGAVITFLMHSSVGAILMVVTFVSVGVLPVEAAASMVLGANLGSATLPLWLGRGMGAKAQRIAMANLLLRGAGSIALLLVVHLTPALGLLDVFSDPQKVVSVHLTFNILLLIITLPIVPLIDGPIVALVRDRSSSNDASDIFKPLSALDPKVIKTPSLAVGSLMREVLRMSQIIEIMARPIMDLYTKNDPQGIQRICDMDDEVNDILEGIRRYAAAIPRAASSKDEIRRIRSLTEYAINLESAGDIVSKRLMTLARNKWSNRIMLSDEGLAELQQLHERVLSNMALAFNVLISDDIESARLLVEEKAEMKLRERKSRKKHFKRLRKGSEQSFESSDIHLESLRWLNDLNSQVSSVAYPILYKHGQLLETRLVHDLDKVKLADGNEN